MLDFLFFFASVVPIRQSVASGSVSTGFINNIFRIMFSQNDSAVLNKSFE